MTLPLITKFKNLKGKKVLLRLSANVPTDGRKITNDFRLRRVLPTLEFLHRARARTVILSHSGKDANQSTRFVVDYLKKYFTVGFMPGTDLSRLPQMLSQMKEGAFLMLDNLRRFPGEIENSASFAKKLARPFDLFCNEDFPVSHRKHASVVGVPRFLPSFIGPVFAEEIAKLSTFFKPKHPFLVILGGAKFETKLPLVRRFLKEADEIFIGGALANSVFKEMGFEVGKSLVDSRRLGLVSLTKDKKIILPKDVVALNIKGEKLIKVPAEVEKKDKILDIGPESIADLAPSIFRAKEIFWNGPMGNFEKGFKEQTEELARLVAHARGYSAVGGGDSIAAIEHLNLLDKFSFVSTAGGAMLEFLACGTLPGIEAILKSKKRL